MSRWATALLLIATVCLLLGQAWIHLYWDTPYEAILGGSLGLPTVARGIGLWLLFCALMIVAWRPAWFASLAIVLGLAPMALYTVASIVGIENERERVAHVAGSAATLITPLILLLAGRLSWRWGGLILARVGLTLTFFTYALLCLGGTIELEVPKLGPVAIGLSRPELWTGAPAELLPDTVSSGQVSAIWMVLGIVAIVGSIGIWFRFFTPVAALLLTLLATMGVSVMLYLGLNGDMVEQLHRWVPEAAIRAPLLLLPLAAWGMSKPRKLKRVEPVPPNSAPSPDRGPAVAGAMQVPENAEPLKSPRKLKRIA